MRYLVLILGLLLGEPVVAQAPLSVVKRTLVWDHPDDSAFLVEVLGEEIQTKELVVRKTGVAFGGKGVSSTSEGLEWCLWLLFEEQALALALKGLKESPDVVVEDERIGVRYSGRGELLIDFETNLPMRLTYFRDDVSWAITWPSAGGWDHVLIYRNGAPHATIRRVASQKVRED